MSGYRGPLFDFIVIFLCTLGGALIGAEYIEREHKETSESFRNLEFKVSIPQEFKLQYCATCKGGVVVINLAHFKVTDWHSVSKVKMTKDATHVFLSDSQDLKYTGHKEVANE